MATSIGKLSKSFFVKLLVGIIILPFVFWGMGDVFRGGNQNVVATVDSNKISTQEFVNYINRLNLNKEQVKDHLKNTEVYETKIIEIVIHHDCKISFKLIKTDEGFTVTHPEFLIVL